MIEPQLKSAFLLLFLSTVGLQGIAKNCSDCFSDWEHVREVRIDNRSNGQELTGHQVKVVLNTKALISNGELEADGKDLRFATEDCEELCFAVDSGMNTTNTVLWVKTDSIPASSRDTIYMFHGNPSASNEADPACTYEFFEGFESGNLNAWHDTCIYDGNYTCGSTGGTGGCADDNCDPSTTTMAKSFHGNSSAMMFGEASCFCSPYNGPVNELQRTVSLPDGDYVLDFYQKEWEEQYDFCSCTDCTPNNINLCIDGNTLYSSDSTQCVYQDCGNCEDPWELASSSCFTVSGGSTEITFWEKIGDCSRNRTWLDDIRIRKCPAPPTTVGDELYPLEVRTSSRRTICGGSGGKAIVDSVTDGAPPYSYDWDDPSGQKGDTASGLLAGNYVVTINDRLGCGTKDTVRVDDRPGPELKLDSLVETPCDDECRGEVFSSVREGVPPYEFRWNDPGIEKDSIVRGLCAKSYKLTVVDSNDCRDELEVELGECELEVPNVITPNGDGKNEAFVIENLDRYPGSSLTVYNRWGKKVYEDPDYENDWKGGKLSDGTYFFVLTPKGKKAPIKGELTVLRDR
jgi:gliding motility-associated-like protein